MRIENKIWVVEETDGQQNVLVEYKSEGVKVDDLTCRRVRRTTRSLMVHREIKNIQLDGQVI